MFESISFAGLKKSPNFAYAAELPFFAGRRNVSFKPGLNILFGPNGCGKSTILQILGDTMCATQGGFSVITEEALRSTVHAPLFGKRPTDGVGLKVAHDGQPVVYVDSRRALGLARGGVLDDDFARAGMHEALRGVRGSHGENSMRRLNGAIGMLAGELELPKRVEYRVSHKNLNDEWSRILGLVEKRVQATSEPGQHSFLLDEPEANLAVHAQAWLWDLLASTKVSDKFQVIVATHSVFALGLPGANYIEMADGILAHARGAFLEKARALGAQA